MKHKQKSVPRRWDLVLLIAVLLLLALLLPRFVSVEESLNTLRNADSAYVWLAIIACASTFLSAALVYMNIALRPLKYGPTLLVQAASGFTNRLLPLGTGIIALNIDYLIKKKHTATQAGAVVALNNILGFLGMLLLIAVAVSVSPHSIRDSFALGLHISNGWLLAIMVTILVGVILLFTVGAKLFERIKTAAVLVARHSTKRPGRLLLALAASMAITMGYAGTLYALGLALNAHLTMIQALFVLTLGVISASVTPTPGGIGGAEVGLIAALIAAGVTSHQAVAVAITYRLITYWLPIVPGLICFRIALRKRYI